MPQTIVWNQLGAQAGEIISSACTEVEVVNIDRDPRQVPEPKAQVLFAAPRRDLPREALPFVDVSWASGVEWVHAAPTGIDQFPQALFENKTVTCARGLSGPAIAEFVLAAVLAFEKQVPEIWSEGPAPEATVLGQVQGKTIGIFGFGAIGRGVAVRAQAFGMSVLATRRTGNPSEIEGVTIVGLDDLLAASDHLVLAAPSTDLTVNLLDAARLRQVNAGPTSSTWPGGHSLTTKPSSTPSTGARCRGRPSTSPSRNLFRSTTRCAYTPGHGSATMFRDGSPAWGTGSSVCSWTTSGASWRVSPCWDRSTASSVTEQRRRGLVGVVVRRANFAHI